MSENDVPQLPTEISALLAAALYAAEYPLTFQAWATAKGFIVDDGGCSHTETEHAGMLVDQVMDGMTAVRQAFSIGQAIISGLGGQL